MRVPGGRRVEILTGERRRGFSRRWRGAGDLDRQLFQDIAARVALKSLGRPKLRRELVVKSASNGHDVECPTRRVRVDTW